MTNPELMFAAVQTLAAETLRHKLERELAFAELHARVYGVGPFRSASPFGHLPSTEPRPTPPAASTTSEARSVRDLLRDIQGTLKGLKS